MSLRPLMALVNVFFCSCASHSVIRTTSAAPELIFVPAGEYLIGSSKNKKASDSELQWRGPFEHKLVVAGFYLDKFEISWAQFEECAQHRQCDFLTSNNAPNLPAVVTFSAAQAYCKFRGMRLLTSIEWEVAARGVDGRNYPWGNALPRKEDYGLKVNDMSSDLAIAAYTGMVSAKNISPFGVIAMAGSVPEFVDSRVRLKDSIYGLARGSSGFDGWQTHEDLSVVAGQFTKRAGVRCGKSS